MGFPCYINYMLNKIAWYEDNATAITVYNVSWQADRTSDFHSGVETSHNKVFNRGGIYSSVINLNLINSFDLLKIPNTTPNYRTASVGAVTNSCTKIAADKRSLVDLVEHIRDYHISIDKRVNHPLIAGTLSAFGCSDFVNDLFKVWPRWDIRAGNCPSHQLSVIMKTIQMAFKLIMVSCIK